MGTLKKLVEHPVANLIVALLLIFTSAVEGWETLREDFLNLQAGVHHGVFLLGVVNLLKTIPELFHAAHHIAKFDAGPDVANAKSEGEPQVAGVRAS